MSSNLINSEVTAKSIAMQCMEEFGDKDINNIGFYIRQAYKGLRLIGQGLVYEQAHVYSTIKNLVIKKPDCFARLIDLRVDGDCEPTIYESRFRFGCKEECRNSFLFATRNITRVKEEEHFFHFSSNGTEGRLVSISYMRYKTKEGQPTFGQAFEEAVISYVRYKTIQRSRMQGSRDWHRGDENDAKRDFLSLADHSRVANMRLTVEEINQVMSDYRDFYYMSKNPYIRTNHNYNILHNFYSGNYFYSYNYYNGL